MRAGMDVRRYRPQWLGGPGTRERRETGEGGTSHNGKPGQ